jgi:hypothetical protein
MKTHLVINSTRVNTQKTLILRMLAEQGLPDLDMFALLV